MVTEVKTPLMPFREVQDGELVVRLHPGQRRAWDSQARFVYMLAGTQGGKTCFGPHWLHREIEACGAGDYLAVTSTYDLFKLKMLPELRAVFEDALHIGRYWAGERVIELAEGLVPGQFKAQRQDDAMWGRIILRSADAKAGLESATAKAAWVDEVGQKEFAREALEGVLRRLSLAQGRLLGTTSLYYWGWLKNDVFDRWRAGDKDIDVIQFESIANPAFPKEEYERAKATMPAWKFNLFYRGLYERPAGLVYDSFDYATCVKSRMPILNEWLWYVGHDFGGANPAAMFYAVDPTTGLFWAVHEYLPGSRSVYQQVEDFKEITKGRNVIKRIGGSHQEEGWRESYTTHGWPIQEPKENVRRVEDGISRVYALHKLKKVMVFSDLTNYIDQLQSYSRKLDDNYQPTEEIENKAAYHLMDAERYILSDFTPETVDSQGPVTSRSYRF